MQLKLGGCPKGVGGGGGYYLGVQKRPPVGRETPTLLSETYRTSLQQGGEPGKNLMYIFTRAQGK